MDALWLRAAQYRPVAASGEERLPQSGLDKNLKSWVKTAGVAKRARPSEIRRGLPLGWANGMGINEFFQ
jgi:hypothetical protein